jgi:hypothetical protein
MTIVEIQAALAEPFDAAEVHLKPQALTKDKMRALPCWYLDARTVMGRLDAAVGVSGWQDEYDVLPSGEVVCRLRLLIDGQWICKADVGAQSEQEDEGDRRKASFSDALKRAAVKWGIGRYLYRIRSSWVGWDDAKKQFATQPVLPPWAVPHPSADQLAKLTALRKARGDAAVRRECETLGFKLNGMSERQAGALIAALENEVAKNVVRAK